VEILNTTRYDSGDLREHIKHVVDAGGETVKSVRIRYLMKPKGIRKFSFKTGPIAIPVDEDANTPWVYVKHQGYSSLDIALLHPDRLPIPPLEALARAADDGQEFADDRIAKELWDAIHDCLCTWDDNVAAPLKTKIRIHKKADPEAKKLAAYREFKEKVERGRDTVKTRKRTLAGAILRRDEAQEQIDGLQTKIPVLQEKQAKLEKELKGRTVKILAPKSRWRHS